MLSFLGIVLGIGLLIAGGTALVAGSSQVANRFGIAPMIIGLTIVGFGTSAARSIRSKRPEKSTTVSVNNWRSNSICSSWRAPRVPKS